MLESLFNKVAGLKASEYCQVFKCTYFEENLRTATSVYKFLHKCSLVILAPFLLFKVARELWRVRESFFYEVLNCKTLGN